MKISEYDAFGPWIYEIDDEHPLPPLFISYVPQDERCLMSFKMPRNIERRKATPDMDLYDYLISAYEDRVQILRRVEHSVESTEVPYSAVEGIKVYRCFLQGLCTLYLADKEVVIPFNTVSIDIMMKLVQIIRSKCMAPEPAGHALPAPFAGTLSDVLFFNLVRDLNDAGESFQVGAFQPSMDIRYRNETGMQKLWNKIKPQSLQSGLHLFSAQELLIIQRGKAAKRRNEFSYDYTYLPLGKIRNLELSDSAYENVTDCSISLSTSRISFGLCQDNLEAIRYYEALCSLIK